MTRVLHLVNHCELGHGNVHAAVDLACGQAAFGHEVTFASAGGHFEALLKIHRVAVSRLSQNVRSPWKAAPAVAAAHRLIKRQRIDVVHAHMMSGTIVGFLASRLSRRPLVTTVHNSFDWHARLMCLGDAVVAVSGAERKYLLERGFTSSKLHEIWNGPLGSPRYVNGQGPSHSPRTKTIVTVCGLHRRKGVADLIDAFAEVVTVAPEWRLAIVGDGPDKDALMARCKMLGIQSSTIFHGTVEDPTLILAQAEIFVLASHAEPFGLAVVEARGAGCAIVTTDVGGLPELTDFGAAGLLVRSGAPADLATALKRLVVDPELRLGLQNAARRDTTRFQMSRLVLDYDRVYKSVLRSKPNKEKTAMPALGRGRA